MSFPWSITHGVPLHQVKTHGSEGCSQETANRTAKREREKKEKNNTHMRPLL